MRSAVGLFVLLALPFLEAKPLLETSTCGYQSCRTTAADELNVHIVPHSHDDVGWLKTVDQYFYGSKNEIQRAGVRYIIDSVIHALNDNPNRRFIQVETLFFRDWWVRQSESKKQEVTKLVESGRLEFIGGGWSMNDEGATHYQSVIDQFDLGLRFLNATFGKCGRPKIGWQIDPFGHSKEMANIFNQMGFDGLFFARSDWRDKSRRLTTKTPEMLWQGSENLGNDSNIFTSILYNHYSAPSGYCFDVLCQDDPIIDSGTEENYEAKVKGFAEFIKNQASRYPTNNIIITMGDDFNYQDALSYFTNLDTLIEGFDVYPQTYNGKKIKVFYSTPSCYVKSVNEAANTKQQAFAHKTDDFFPYASDPHAYWTGYFTSRPTSKRYERQASNLLQIVKQLKAQTSDPGHSSFRLESAVGIMQHHDAITGTEKQHVANDYHKILHEEVENALENINSIYKILLSKNQSAQFDLKLHNCILANISVCSHSLGDNFLVAVYNPLNHPVNNPVRLPVDTTEFKITGPFNETIQYQISPRIDDFKNMGQQHHAKYDLVFMAENVPPVGTLLYFISKKSAKEYKYEIKKDTSSNRFNLGDEKLGVKLDNRTGLLESITVNGKDVKVRQELMYYIGARGSNEEFAKRASGAYIFRPDPHEDSAQPFKNIVDTVTYRGDVYDEVHQDFGSWAKQIIRVYKMKSYVEFDWLVGPISDSDSTGKEVISRFITELDTGDVFYTDSNGKELVRRIRNNRSTYNYTNEEPVAGNYYPVTTKITLKDDNTRISVMNDRAQGGTSLGSGEMEVMLHRRCLMDDAFGVGEALNEVQFGEGTVARGSLFLTITGRDLPNIEVEKQTELEKSLAAWTFISTVNSNISIEELGDNIHFNFSAANANVMPKNLKVLTLDKSEQHENATLIRLEHIYEKGEDPELSKDIEIDIQILFKSFIINSLRETTLDGNKWLDEVAGLEWIQGGKLEHADYTENFETGSLPEKKAIRVQSEKDFIIKLKPTEIRTFVLFCTYKY